MALSEALTYAKNLEGVLIPYEKAEGIGKTREIIGGLKGKNPSVFLSGRRAALMKKRWRRRWKPGRCR